MRFAHLKMHPASLLWRLPLSAGFVAGGTALLSAIWHAQGLLLFLVPAGATCVVLWISLRQPLAQLRRATIFSTELVALHGRQLPLEDSRSTEIHALSQALNGTARALHDQDNILNQAYTALQEQQYAFDQHAIVSILDRHGALLYANDRLCAIAGYTRAELIGRPFTLLSAEADPLAYHQMLWECLQKGEVWHGEMRIKTRSGSIGWVDASLVPTRNTLGEIRQYICIQTDVTERKRNAEALAANQKALEMLTENLEQLIRQRTAELEKSNEDLMQANQVKSDFISIVSHELRTPLTSIKSFAEILDDEVTDPEAKRCLRIINEEADRLNRLINDILDLQKIEAGRMVWRDEKVNLVDLARAALETFSGAYATKQIGLVLNAHDLTLCAIADSDKLRQVLANLLSNALKYTSVGKVEVSVARVWDIQSKAPHLQIAVADTGSGLAASQLERIFEHFYQVDDAQSRKVQGTGLGLAICKQIIDHYQGRLWAESELGRGTTILFTLPDATDAPKKLGEILVDLGYLTGAEIEQALRHQRRDEESPAVTPTTQGAH